MLIKHIFLPLEICNRRLTMGSNQLWFKERIIVGLKPIDCHYIHTCLVWFVFYLKDGLMIYCLPRIVETCIENWDEGQE